ncbi:MAG: LysR family transcriptional regulator [Casimicrobium sp.]
MGPGNRPLDLDWLEDFLALAETGNFSRAALTRNIAQPAFSRHIKSLEEWVGVALFDRATHPVSLTAAGARIRPEIEATLQRLENARHAARAAHEQAAVSLQFAATHALSLTFFPAWLSGLEGRISVGPIQMVSDSFAACEDLMLQRRAQFLLCHGHPAVPGRLDDTQFTFANVGDDLLVPVSAARNGTALHSITAKSAALPVLAYGEGSGIGQIMRSVMREKFASAGFATVFTSHHAVLLKTMAIEGRGVAWLPQSLVAQDVEAGRLLHAAGEAWQVPIDIRLVRPRVTLTDAAEALWRVVCGADASAAKAQ